MFILAENVRLYDCIFTDTLSSKIVLYAREPMYLTWAMGIHRMVPAVLIVSVNDN